MRLVARSEPARRRRRPSYADVMSTLAVVLALTMGSAYAAGLGRNEVKSRNIADDAVRTRHLADGVVDGDRIQDESITSIDVAPNGISSARMTVGVQNLLFNAGTVPVNQTFGDVEVTSSSWPSGAPSSGTPLAATWTQPADTVDVVSGTARIEYPASCSATASGDGRGVDVKIVDGDGRVISSSAAQRTGGANYNGNGFWSQQTDLPGVSFRAPFGSDLAANPASFIDYVHLPFELAEFVTGGSETTNTVRVYAKRNSSNCTPTLTNVRIYALRYAD